MPLENNQQDTNQTDLVATSTISPDLVQKQEIQKINPSSEQRDPTEKKEKRKARMKTIVDFIKLFFSWNVISMTLAHHPECETFNDHVFKIGKIRLCRGCTLSYPPLYATVLIFIFWLDARSFLTATGLWIPNLWWFTIGFGVTGALALLLRKYSLFINDIYKFSRGAFAGFLIAVIFSQHWTFKIAAGVLLIGAMVLLSLHRGKDMEKTCEECEWKANYDECPGWKDITQDFSKVISSNQTSPLQNSSASIINDQQMQDEKIAEVNQKEGSN